MMRLPAFRDVSVRTKLIIIMLAVSLPALLSVSATLLVYDVHQARQQMNEELGALTQLLGDRSSAALVFGDRQLARDNLAALRGLTHISAACLYGEDRTLFAEFVREPSESACSAFVTDVVNTPAQNVIQVSRNIVLEGHIIGRVVVTALPKMFDEYIWRRLVSGAFVLLIAVFITVGLGVWMQRVIARPIERVTAVAASIGTSGDAQLRAPVPGQDEIGQLARAFNAMLDNLQQQHSQQLESEARFRVLVEQAGDAIFLHDPRGRIVDANQQACRSLGYTREELLKMSVSDIETEVAPEQALAIWDSMQAGVPVTVEGTHRRKNGSLFPVEVRVGLFETNGEQFTLAIVRDISERRRSEQRLRASEARLAEAQRIAHVGSWELDLTDNRLSWSDEIYRIFEIDPARHPASYPQFLAGVHPEDRDLVNQAYTDSVANRTSYDIVHRLLMADGRIKYVREVGETVYAENGEPLRSLGTVQDVTELKRAEDRLHDYQEHLEDLVSERTRQVTATNQELEAFSYSVSHDLRAPLRAIDGFSRILLEDHALQLDAAGRDSLARVRQAAQRMGVLIDELLELSRVGRAEMRLTDVDLTQLANEVVEQLRAAEPVRTVEVSIAPALAGRGDERLLRLVLQNLLGNAWKYTARTADARIELGAIQQNGETVYCVSDNGAGFDMAYVDKLFKPFQRLHRAEDYQGTGVGLAIVARIVNRHGGRVWAEGELGKGATFYFLLGVSR